MPVLNDLKEKTLEHQPLDVKRYLVLLLEESIREDAKAATSKSRRKMGAPPSGGAAEAMMKQIIRATADKCARRPCAVVGERRKFHGLFGLVEAHVRKSTRWSLRASPCSRGVSSTK